ncbi:MAG TPA: monovalent cation/H(+) antiporter subunit G [Trebonia sp.]
MIRNVITDVLLALAAATVIASAIGVLVVRDAYARVHYVTPAAVVAPVLVALAIFVTEGLDENTGETVVALVFMVAAAPFLSHATMRAIRVREDGDWRGRRPAEDAEDSAGTEGQPKGQQSDGAPARRSR